MSDRLRVVAASATGCLSSERLPVGGGVAVLEALLPELAAQPGTDVRLLVPGSSGRSGQRAELPGVRVTELEIPSLRGRDPGSILDLDELPYSRFALQWEAALGRFFADLSPQDASRTVVLSNDVSEGPPFAELARRGLPQVVLYHVVVGDFFARRYLRARSSRAIARLARGLERLGVSRLLPDAFGLVWPKEREAARHAYAVVPSPDLGRALADLYPGTGVAERTSVVPWGVIGCPDPARRHRREEVLAGLELPSERSLLLTLGRISPEKRIELLLTALERLEREEPGTAEGLALVVGGAPAYMGGRAYAERVRRRASRLRAIPVRFAGYVTGERKWDLLAAADLFCSTSLYEAYGLTIAQALASGTPALSTDHQGARAILEPDSGLVVPPRPAAIAAGLRSLLGEADRTRAERRRAAAAWGAKHPFRSTARRVGALLREAARPA